MREATPDAGEPLLTIADVMERLPGASERAVRAMARRAGCFRAFGRAMLFSEDDFNELLQAAKCPSNSTSEKDGPVGRYVAPSAERELKRALERLTKSSPKKSGSSAKANSNVRAFSGRPRQ